MTENRLLTFELTSNAASLEIYCDHEGLKDLIHRVERLSMPKNLAIPDHDHWLAESIGGHDLTDQRQARDTMLCVMVTAHYLPPLCDQVGVQTGGERRDAPRQTPEPALLTFETSPPSDNLRIFGNADGLRCLAERLRRIAAGNASRPLDECWTTKSLGDGLLSEEKQSEATTLIKQVVLHYRPSVPLA